jgi:DNA recombination protein RmuC
MEVHMIYVLTAIAVIILAVELFMLTRKADGINKEEIKSTFAGVAMDVLRQQKEIGGQELDRKKELIDSELASKKQLIDQRLDAMNLELNKVESTLQAFSNRSGEKIDGVSGRLDNAAQVIKDLSAATGRLNEMLSSTQKRGEWGQRMAKDILDLAGLREGINYTQQASTETGRPDFTFMLPNGTRVNMDCKFPLSNYKAYIDSKSAAEKELYLRKFLSDGRARLKETAKRDYIDPDNGTLDYAVMFISNEQVFGFINENDGAFMDDALKMKVIACSPFTLYAFVSVIHQASENFKMEKASREILAQLGKFAKQWEEFKCHFDEVGESIEKTRQSYDRLVTTRTRMLEVPIKAVEKIREDQGIKPAE